MSHNVSLPGNARAHRRPGGYPARAGRLFLLLVLLFALVGGSTLSVRAATTIAFTGEELLGKPEDASITINIVPATTIEYHYQYGTSPGSNTWQTANVTATGGQPSEVVISGLTANTQYYYRMQYHAPGDAMDDWVNRTEHSFWTQRAAGSTFMFTVTSDSHQNFNTAEQNAMTNILSEHPDFNVDLGDTFLLDGSANQDSVNNKYLAYREPLYFDKIGNSVPIFLASGNHEDEEGWNIDDAFSLAVASIKARKLYYPTPVTDGFYSGNEDTTLTAIGGDNLREDYYAWTWGDALFMVIDEFQYTMHNPYGAIAGEGSDDPKTCEYSNDPNCQWNWTLGAQQYQWFQQTLENSHAKYKFIFSHNMLGGKLTVDGSSAPGYVRGGCEGAPYFEWGGKNADGTEGFADRRTATYGADAEPLRQLMMENGVSAYFHGHDHQYVYETCDGMVYQEVPSPGMGGAGFSDYTQDDHGTYNTIKILPNSGHLRITVTPSQATVDYISSATSNNGAINYTYTIAPNTPVVTHNLTVNVSPSGAGTTSPSGTTAIAEGSVVGITATANTGYAFDHWSDACTGNGACSVTMDADKSVTAHFVAVPTHTLTMTVDPTGGGTTNPSVGVHTYEAGSSVDVTASANAGYTFDYWTGACTGSGSCSVTLDADKSVTAHFASITYDLTIVVNPVGGGTTNPAAGVHNYAYGSVVNVTQSPNTGYAFSSWSGDCSGSGSCSVTMTANRNVTANYTAVTGNVTSAATPDNTALTAGQSVVVSINVDMSGMSAPNNALGSFTGSLAWDPAVLAYDSYSGPLGGFTGAVNAEQASSGLLSFNGAKASGASGNNVTFQFTLHAIGAGTSALNLEYEAIAAATTFTNLLPQLIITDGQVTVSAGKLGEVNGDSLVNSTDALIVLSADAGINTSQFCPMNCGDANGDGLVNSTDALIILSYDAQMSVPFPVGTGACRLTVTQPLGCGS
jgi:uncharacterized repeat protein (TIGR02543 family)